MLGELYYPKGQALETAQAVLEVEKPMAVNVAYGCVNKCAYCFGRKIYGKDMSIRFTKEHPLILIYKQQKEPSGVFISFMTDPMLDIKVCYELNLETIKIEKFETTLRQVTLDIIRYLIDDHFHTVIPNIALLTKCSYPVNVFERFKDNYGKKILKKIRLGITVASTHKDWYKKFESNTLEPTKRIEKLRELHNMGYYTWLSFEPDPPPAIFKHDPIRDVLHKCAFVDLVVYGKMNYLKGSNTKEARQYYAEQIPEIEKFCKEHNIKLHVKKKTIEFVKNVKNVKKEG